MQPGSGQEQPLSMPHIAILGGDHREAHIAQQLSAAGHRVTTFGCSDSGPAAVSPPPSAEAAVRDAAWIICPMPGLGDGDRVYAPSSPEPIIVNQALLASSRAQSGGLILGQATKGVTAAARDADVRVFEMKGDRSLAIANATAVAEAAIALLISKTNRVLPEHRILILGYGATGAAITDALLGLTCRVSVAAHRPELLARARQCGATPVSYEDRVTAMASSDIVITTVPSTTAIPETAHTQLHHATVIDIASPPGGTNHEHARITGIDLTWARGLAGKRAPLSAGNAQLHFITSAINQQIHPHAQPPTLDLPACK
jgi:dipicolinate synthase subunit A